MKRFTIKPKSSKDFNIFGIECDGSDDMFKLLKKDFEYFRTTHNIPLVSIRIEGVVFDRRGGEYTSISSEEYIPCSKYFRTLLFHRHAASKDPKKKYLISFYQHECVGPFNDEDVIGITHKTTHSNGTTTSISREGLKQFCKEIKQKCNNMSDENLESVVYALIEYGDKRDQIRRVYSIGNYKLYNKLIEADYEALS